MTTSTDSGAFLTIDAPIDHELTVSRSRFIASIRTVRDRKEFDAQHAIIMAAFPKATHYCWAYRFSGAIPIEHSSDAGEPAGTAGRPILGALKKYSLLNTMAVVTRYFGGIKLGVKGLIAAYGDAVRDAIEASKIVEMEPGASMVFTCSYDIFNKLLAISERHGISASSFRSSFSDTIVGEVNSTRSKITALLAAIEENFPRDGAISASLKLDQDSDSASN